MKRNKNAQVKKNCFAYNEVRKECNALKELYCTACDCSFYKDKSEYNADKVEAEIKEWARYH